jgi:hypothetical protein
MKAFAARATLVILPLIAFSTPSFATQGLPAVKQKQEIRVSNPDQNLKKMAHHHRHNGCCQASPSARSDDELTEHFPAATDLKRLYQE